MTKFETAPQLALRWGMTRGRVHQLIVSGALPAVKVGRDWLIPNQPDRKEIFENAKKLLTAA
jgi:hypothetical protein